MTFLNLGILAHVDAGKTSLTERLLFDAGVIDEIGSVDAGNTQTDSLPLEQRRGITIRAAVVSFVLDGAGSRTVNLIDTPGHPDFIAEVERVLGVLDGAVLVLSAVEGVQAQTRILMRALQRLRVPTLLFVNKIDRVGARHDDLLDDIRRRLTPAIVAMGTTHARGTREAGFVPYPPGDPDWLERTGALLADHDDELLAAYVQAGELHPDRVRAALAMQTAAGRVHPVFFGSAITGAGIAELRAGIAALLPDAPQPLDAEPSGLVFKIDRGPRGQKRCYVRMFAGCIRPRDRIALTTGGADTMITALVTGVEVFADGGVTDQTLLGAGGIGRLTGLGSARIGTVLGAPTGRPVEHRFAPPTLESVVVPDRPSDRVALFAALTELAEQDPLIDVRRDPERATVSVSLYGEVQKEVIATTLAEEYGLAVTFTETSVLCVERLTGTAKAVEVIDTPGNPYLATVGLRVEPGHAGSGGRFGLDVELGSMPAAFFHAVEQAVAAGRERGPHGWPVPDLDVTMTDSGYWARQSHMGADFDKSMSSTAGDFRLLTPLVLMDALRRAGTEVLEPILRFRIDGPGDRLAIVLPALAGVRAVPRRTTTDGDLFVVEGEIPAARLHELERRLPGLTGGEGVIEAAFARYARVTGGAVPMRPWVGPDPRERERYLRQAPR